MKREIGRVVAKPNAPASEIVYDAGLRRAETDQARATYDASMAAYRQTVFAVNRRGV